MSLKTLIRRTLNYSLIAIALSFTACQSATPYKSVEKTDGPYGYESKKVNKNLYRISFKGNENTSRETVEKYLLYRAAEVAQKHKAKYFKIVDRDTNKIVDYEKSYSNAAFTRPYTTGFAGYNTNRYPYYSYGYGWSYNDGATVVKEDLYSAVAYIKLKRKASKSTKVFTTSEVIRRLREDVGGK